MFVSIADIQKQLTNCHIGIANITMTYSSLLIATRVYGELSLDKLQENVKPFLENALKFGHVLIVSQREYKHLPELKKLIANHNQNNNIDLKYANPADTPNNAEMCNVIIHHCKGKRLQYLAIISNDLGEYIPKAIPPVLGIFQKSPQITSVGLAIKGVHNMQLLEEIRKGTQKITPENFATVFYNNAFSINRLEPITTHHKLSVADRLFPQEIDQADFLEPAIIDGRAVKLGGNEEIAIVLKLLQKGINLNTILLAGDYTIIRDASKEISSVDDKVIRRQKTADGYQQHFGIPKEMLQQYLDKHNEIIFQ